MKSAQVVDFLFFYFLAVVMLGCEEEDEMDFRGN